MRVLMISSYPPVPCGIGTYAAQHVTALRNDGHVVDVLAHPAVGPDGDLTADLLGGWRLFKLVRYAWAYDQIILQFTPNFFFRADDAMDRLRTSLAWLVLCILFGRKFKVVVHETEFRLDDMNGARGFRSRIDRIAWRLCGKIVFHSERERDAFCTYYRLKANPIQFLILAHDRHFRSHASGERDQMRAILGLPRNKTLFICIGFIQPHKGYDRLLKAVSGVTSNHIIARIVGSVRINWQPAIDYAKQLHDMAERDERCEFIEEFVTDEDFDRWIIAADYVVVPYHEIWSSGVAARAKLHNRPVIASNVGALPEQLPAGSSTFSTDQELSEVIARIAERHA